MGIFADPYILFLLALETHPFQKQLAIHSGERCYLKSCLKLPFLPAELVLWMLVRESSWWPERNCKPTDYQCLQAVVTRILMCLYFHGLLCFQLTNIQVCIDFEVYVVFLWHWAPLLTSDSFVCSPNWCQRCTCYSCSPFKRFIHCPATMPWALLVPICWYISHVNILAGSCFTLGGSKLSNFNSLFESRNLIYLNRSSMVCRVGEMFIYFQYDSTVSSMCKQTLSSKAGLWVKAAVSLFSEHLWREIIDFLGVAGDALVWLLGLCYPWMVYKIANLKATRASVV